MTARGFLTPQLAILIGVAAVIACLTIWAYSERAGRLACEVERVQLRDAYQVLAGKVQEQNAAVTDLQRRSQAAMAQSRAALNVANVEAAKRQAEVDYWREQAARPTPAGATCATAWAEIRQRLNQPTAVKP